jgi:hypothetical protein
MFYNIKVLLLSFGLSALLPFAFFSMCVIFEAWYWNRAAKDAMLVIVLLFGMAIIGSCAGLSGGMSRVGAVGSIIPAMFTLLGGVVIYLFGVDTTPRCYRVPDERMPCDLLVCRLRDWFSD